MIITDAVTQDTLRTLTGTLVTDTTLSAAMSAMGMLHRRMGTESFSIATPGMVMPHLRMAATAIIGIMATVAVFASRRRTSGFGSGTEVSNLVIRRDERSAGTSLGLAGLAECE